MDSDAWVIPLAAASCDEQRIGGKAVQLARLHRAGFRIAPGFCVTVDPQMESRYDELAADFDLVAGELKRIAGSAYTAGLQIHWADVPPDCYQVLADRGVKMLATRGRKRDSTDRKICD